MRFKAKSELVGETKVGKFWTIAAACLALGATAPAPAAAQPKRPDMTAQREALKKLAWMDGTWVGVAKGRTPQGEAFETLHTERVGPMIDGAIRVFEGKSYEKDGRPSSFNAFAFVAYDDLKGAYTMTSYADGRTGAFPLTVTPDGWFWEMPAGPATIRYTTTFDGTTWTEVGDWRPADGAPQRFFEMTLKRTGSTDWPAAGAVRP